MSLETQKGGELNVNKKQIVSGFLEGFKNQVSSIIKAGDKILDTLKEHLDFENDFDIKETTVDKGIKYDISLSTYGKAKIIKIIKYFNIISLLEEKVHEEYKNINKLGNTIIRLKKIQSDKEKSSDDLQKAQDDLQGAQDENNKKKNTYVDNKSLYSDILASLSILGVMYNKSDLKLNKKQKQIYEGILDQADSQNYENKLNFVYTHTEKIEKKKKTEETKIKEGDEILNENEGISNKNKYLLIAGLVGVLGTGIIFKDKIFNTDKIHQDNNIPKVEKNKIELNQTSFENEIDSVFEEQLDNSNKLDDLARNITNNLDISNFLLTDEVKLDTTIENNQITFSIYIGDKKITYTKDLKEVIINKFLPSALKSFEEMIMRKISYENNQENIDYLDDEISLYLTKYLPIFIERVMFMNIVLPEKGDRNLDKEKNSLTFDIILEELGGYKAKITFDLNSIKNTNFVQSIIESSFYENKKNYQKDIVAISNQIKDSNPFLKKEIGLTVTEYPNEHILIIDYNGNYYLTTTTPQSP